MECFFVSVESEQFTNTEMCQFGFIAQCIDFEFGNYRSYSKSISVCKRAIKVSFLFLAVKLFSFIFDINGCFFIFDKTEIHFQLLFKFGVI